MLRGEEMWCQLFSEPAAGSDLPALITRAERDGDDFVVNGQKVWTTMAQYSDWGDPARTDRPKCAGAGGALVLPASTWRRPGIDVRPLRQITGVAHFNEVFLTDVRVPAANLVGAAGRGVERGPHDAGGRTDGDRSGRRDIVRRRRGALPGSGRRGRPRPAPGGGPAYIGFELLRFLGFRVQTALCQGRAPGAEASLLKLAFSRQSARLGDLGMALLGPSGIATDGRASAAGFWRDRFLGQWSMRIGGGTDEIQRNQIGERVLGLPREPSVQIQYPT